MTSFEENILNRVPGIMKQREDIRHEREVLSAHEIEQNRIINKQSARITELGMQAVKLLRDYDVDTVTIWDRNAPRDGVIKQVGEGWHLMTIFDRPSEGLGSPTNHGMDIQGNIFEFSYPTYEGRQTGENGKQWSGIIFPHRPRMDIERLRVLESEQFKNGLASLIARCGPFIFH